MKNWIFALMVSMVCSVSAHAETEFFRNFKTAYPRSATKSFMCKICHEGSPSDMKFNAYGIDYEKLGPDFVKFEQFDSDGDGIKNIDEINRGTNPGDKDSN